MREAPILVATELALSRMREPDGRRTLAVFRRTVGLLVSPNGHPIKTGVEGQADLHGFLWTGRAFECEVKSPTGKLSPAQLNWRRLCEQMNVLWILARSPEHACEEVRRALR